MNPKLTNPLFDAFNLALKSRAKEHCWPEYTETRTSIEDGDKLFLRFPGISFGCAICPDGHPPICLRVNSAPGPYTHIPVNIWDYTKDNNNLSSDALDIVELGLIYRALGRDLPNLSVMGGSHAKRKAHLAGEDIDLPGPAIDFRELSKHETEISAAAAELEDQKLKHENHLAAVAKKFVQLKDLGFHVSNPGEVIHIFPNGNKAIDGFFVFLLHTAEEGFKPHISDSDSVPIDLSKTSEFLLRVKDAIELPMIAPLKTVEVATENVEVGMDIT